ncbi:MAG: hypothetical protein EOO40_02545 [Deltaproteobacteria bacterium]|nr:MAG: hypothetical protein EOO40_02545 [Deltaproteobacteria bacterium]
MALQIANSTCPAKECTLLRDSVYVFEQGQLAYGEDLQMLEQRADDMFCLVSHNDRQVGGGRVVSLFTGYGFTVLPTGKMVASVVTNYLVSQENVGVLQHGCSCSYLAQMSKDVAR